jgi:hypothetical protein
VAEPDSFDFGGFDEAYDISDFGEDQAFSTSEMAPVTTMFGGGNFVDTGVGDGDSIASILNPALGSGNRTNITNVGAGSNLVYDPAFAAALDIRRNIDPTLNLGGTGGLTVPSYLRPQIPGEFMDSDLGEADMVRPMFFSQGEKFLQQTLPEIVKSGPIARLARGIGSVFQEGIDFAKDATAGINLPSLKEIGQGFTNFMDRFRPRETDTNPMNMLEAAVRDEVPNVTYAKGAAASVPDALYPGQNTFGTMPMNTGIASVRPQQMQDVDRNVADALQLIPSNLETNPIAPISKVQITDPVGVSSALPTEEDREKRDFARDVFASSPSLRQQQFGRFNQDFINRTLNAKPFDDSGTFINLDNV